METGKDRPSLVELVPLSNQMWLEVKYEMSQRSHCKFLLRLM